MENNGKRLRVYHSFDEAADAMVNESPAERIRKAVQLSLQEYGVTEEQLKERRGKLHIKIVRYESGDDNKY